jgi:chorismate synthase
MPGEPHGATQKFATDGVPAQFPLSGDIMPRHASFRRRNGDEFAQTHADLDETQQ